VHCDPIVSEGNVVADLHLVEQPVRIALQYLGKMHADIASGLTKAIHDSAQRGFVDAQHARQTVLPDASGVHPQLEVRVNVSIQGHDLSLGFCSAAALPWKAEMAVVETVSAIGVPNRESLICQHIVEVRKVKNSQILSTLPEVSKRYVGSC
jgi:hypothetical protein